MPRRLDYGSRGDWVLESLCQVISRGGLRALSVRAVAKEMDLSPSSLLHQFTDQSRLFRVAAARIGNARLTQVSYRSIEEGLLAFVPRTEHELEQARASVAFQELARTDADIGSVVTDLRNQQRELLERIGRGVLDESGVDALAALIEGVLAAMLLTDSPLTAERARAAVVSYAQVLGLPAEAPPFTSAS